MYIVMYIKCQLYSLMYRNTRLPNSVICVKKVANVTITMFYSMPDLLMLIHESWRISCIYY